MKLQDRGNAAAVVFDNLNAGDSPDRLRKTRQGRWAVLMAVAPLLGCAVNARATDATYTGVSGNWSDALMWTPGLPSQPNDAAILAPLSGTALVTLDVDVTNLRQLDFTPVGTNYVTFAQATNNLAIDGNLFMGGLGCTYNQNGGTTVLGGSNNAGGSLFIGNNAGDGSLYNLSGGALSVGGNSFIGNSGAGVFNHINGSHAVGGDCCWVQM